MHWLLQENTFRERAYDTLIETLQRFNYSYSLHKVVPFIGEIEPPYTDTRKNVICFGSYSLRHLAKKNDWYPGVFDLEDIDFTVQKENWGRNMLNYNSEIVEFGKAKFTEDEMFIRPIKDSKVFTGCVMNKKQFEEWQERVCVLELDDGSSLRSDTLIQLCRVLDIYSEHRFWVVRGCITTYSTYKVGNKVIYTDRIDKRIKDFAYKMTLYDFPCEAYVIDIADTPFGLKIIETNTLNSSGFYAADIQKLVVELNRCFNKGDFF